MALSSEEEREKLLRAVGTSPQDVYELDSGEEEALEPEEEPIETQEQEVSDIQEEPEDGKEEEPAEVTEDDLVRAAAQRFAEHSKPAPQPDQSELDRLRQEVATLKDVLGTTVAKTEQSLKSAPEPEEEDSEEIDWRSPEVSRVLAQEMGLDEEQAGHLAPIMGTVAEFVAEKKFGKKLSSIEKQIEEKEKKSAYQSEMDGYWNNLSQGLQYAAGRGGIEGAVVKNFLEDKGASLLARHFQKFPSKLSSSEGVLDAVVSVARSVQLMESEETPKDEQAKDAPVIQGTKEQVLGAIGKAKSTNSSNKQLSPEEEIKKSIMNAKRNPNSGLPKGFFG